MTGKEFRAALDRLEKKIADEYEFGGMTVPEIAEKYRKEYRDFFYKETGVEKVLTKATVWKFITLHCSEEWNNKERSRFENEIMRMLGEGMAIRNIAAHLGISETKAISYRAALGRKCKEAKPELMPVTQDDVNRLCETLKDGSEVLTMVEQPYIDRMGNNRFRLEKCSAKIISMSRYGAQTDRGFMRYTDMVRYMRMANGTV